MAIRIVINYARSGGTLLAKCLDRLPNTLVLSEIHPRYETGKSLWVQVQEQCGLELKSSSFSGAITELHEYCNNEGLRLVIRDWSFIDWTPHKINGFKPSFGFSLLKAIPGEIETSVIAFVRDPIDIWISRWFPPRFFDVYKHYAKAIVKEKFPLFKFEDFCLDPDMVMKEICLQFDLEFNKSFREFYLSRHIQGDQTDWEWSRSNTRKILLPKRKYLTSKRRGQLSKIQSENELFNYSRDYESRQIEVPSYPIRVRAALQYWLESAGLKSAKEQY